MLAILERFQFFILGLTAVLLLAGAVVLHRSEGSPPALIVYEAALEGDSVVVHVAGAVGSPGLYELPAGARVSDAIAAAGGATSQAAVESVNLARRLRDGEKVTVPIATSSARTSCPPLAAEESLDLNSATQCQLMQLSGIGEAYSRRIVDSRSVDGPYESVDDLLARRLIPMATFEQVRGRLTVAGP